MNQNLSSYRIFYTVANTGNISKAAKELYISQPAISKSIQKLEEGDVYKRQGYVYQQKWPEFDEAKTVENTVEIAVQINGKTKGTLAIGRNDAKDDVIAKAKESIADKLTGNIVKEIYVPGRIVNIVMK